MTVTAGIDVGSTYTKAILVDENLNIIAREMRPSGFKLTEVSHTVFQSCLDTAGLTRDDIDYIVGTGIGRHQIDFKDIHVTDLTASARGAARLFPQTRTILDIGGQTMKVTRLDQDAKVTSFRLNDKCAAGTGAFLEKTARYMGYKTEEISQLMGTSKDPVTISGVCAVFAESEVINHLSMGTPPADIMLGAIKSLVDRAVQLLKRAKAEQEYTLIGGIMRFEAMSLSVRELLQCDVNVPADDMVQFVTAMGAAILGQRRLEKLRSENLELSEPAS